jgi:selenocysteine-specific elongation factor
MKVHSITLGTAGHIDHGKSELIRTLTGIHPDRLKEERERGMTIDLGYSYYESSQGLTVGIIDVPGHERFIKNMVAGATSMNLVILVVAADDGVMPQTREHLNIMTTLGVAKGFVALTKIDLVDEEMAELAGEDVKDLVTGTFLEGMPIVPISSVTGEGFDRLRAILDEQIGSIVPEDPTGAFRMPIQRVFSAKGFGTVVTGVPTSGRIEVGEAVEVLPEGLTGRIRGIQAYDQARKKGQAGHRTALNISDIDYHDIKRGDCVITPGSFRATNLFEADLVFFGTMGFPLRNMSDVRVHAGTAEVMARVVLLERKVLEPGGTSLVQLRLREPVVIAPGDPFILRLHSPLVTIGGGRVVGLSSMRLKRYKDYIVNRVAAKRDGLSDVKTQVLIECESWSDLSATVADLALALNADQDRVAAAVVELKESGDLVEVRKGRFMHKGRFDRTAGEVAAFLEDRHRADPLSPFVDVKLLKPLTGIEGAELQALLRAFEERGLVETAKGGCVRTPGFVPTPTAAQEAFIEQIERSVLEAGATPPTARELIDAGNLSAGEADPAIRYLVAGGRFVKAGPFLFHKETLDTIGKAIVEVAGEGGEVSIPVIRDRFRTSRKWMIPMMEYFDSIGLTRRAGDKRFLKGGS